MRVHIDDERCRGHGMCCSTCPEVFRLSEDGFAVALVGEIPAEYEDAVRTAIDQCPEHAISIVKSR